ncbi:hypothetical protein JXM67_13370 [candidate division WOR-3 bacterium]|nr:hypothetical protein [candidate division WOR-3 bacterium]
MKKKPARKPAPTKVPKEIDWRVFLAPEHPWKTSIIAIVLAGVVFMVGYFVYDLLPKSDSSLRILPSILAGFLTFLLFFGSFNNYFIPISYHMDREEIVIKKFYFKDHRPWKMFRRFFLTRSGVVLSTFATRKKFLDNFRGVQLLLPTDKEKRKKVLDFISSKVPLDSGQSL